VAATQWSKSQLGRGRINRQLDGCGDLLRNFGFWTKADKSGFWRERVYPLLTHLRHWPLLADIDNLFGQEANKQRRAAMLSWSLFKRLRIAGCNGAKSVVFVVAIMEVRLTLCAESMRRSELDNPSKKEGLLQRTPGKGGGECDQVWGIIICRCDSLSCPTCAGGNTWVTDRYSRSIADDAKKRLDQNCRQTQLRPIRKSKKM